MKLYWLFNTLTILFNPCYPMHTPAILSNSLLSVANCFFYTLDFYRSMVWWLNFMYSDTFSAYSAMESKSRWKRTKRAVGGA